MARRNSIADFRPFDRPFCLIYLISNSRSQGHCNNVENQGKGHKDCFRFCILAASFHEKES